MSKIVIDSEKCVGCSLCVKDCVAGHISIEGGKACAKEGRCIECGHCYAVCPQHAITMEGYADKDEPVVPMTSIDPQQLLAAMRSRRSIRQFKDKAVEQEKIDMILEAGRYSPTGSNRQEVSYIILGDKQAEIEKECVELFMKGKKAVNPFTDIVKNFDVTPDFFFKGAPLVILVCCPSGLDGGLASSYMELMAESLGLGVLYSGFFCMAAKFSRKVKSLLNLQKGQKIVSCMVIGYPNVEYKRIVERKELNCTVLK